MSHVTCHSMMSHKMKSHDNFGKVVHRPCSNCISSVQEMHKNSIEFSLSSTDKGAVGFILAQELAILTILCFELCVKVSPLCFTPTTVCEAADSVVCQVAMLPSFNSLWGQSLFTFCKIISLSLCCNPLCFLSTTVYGIVNSIVWKITVLFSNNSLCKGDWGTRLQENPQRLG